MSELSPFLAGGCRLEHYIIESSLGSGGFSCVYRAYDSTTHEKVVIKEYFPKKLAKRLENGSILPNNEADEELFMQGRKLFLHEATTLATLKHPNIVNVLNFFDANDTVYLVMAHEEGVNLQSYIRTHGGKMSERFLRTVFPPLLDGLRLIHSRGLLHLDIKPGNIHICRGGRPLLLDFGAVHKRHLSRKQQTQVVTPGFSPVEQNNPDGYMGPWTDVYAIGASMRACIEGHTPLAAEERVENDVLRPAAQAFKRKYSPSLLCAIDWAMEPDPLLRPQSVDDFLAAMNKDENGDAGNRSSESLMERLSSNFPWI